MLSLSLSFVKSKISLAPNNDSAWNYLRGVLNHTLTPYSTLRDFIIPYTVPHPSPSPSTSVIDLENPLPSPMSELPCPAALEFLAEIHESDQREEGIKEAVLARISLLFHMLYLISLVTQLYKQLSELDQIRKL